MLDVRGVDDAGSVGGDAAVAGEGAGEAILGTDADRETGAPYLFFEQWRFVSDFARFVASTEVCVKDLANSEFENVESVQNIIFVTFPAWLAAFPTNLRAINLMAILGSRFLNSSMRW